jgi:hypothetical protein
MSIELMEYDQIIDDVYKVGKKLFTKDIQSMIVSFIEYIEQKYKDENFAPIFINGEKTSFITDYNEFMMFVDAYFKVNLFDKISTITLLERKGDELLKRIARMYNSTFNINYEIFSADFKNPKILYTPVLLSYQYYDRETSDEIDKYVEIKGIHLKVKYKDRSKELTDKLEAVNRLVKRKSIEKKYFGNKVVGSFWQKQDIARFIFVPRDVR